MGPGPTPGQRDVAVGGPFPSLLLLPRGLGSLLLPQVSFDPRPPLTWARSVLFNPDGCCLYSGCQDSLRVYGWEPERCFDVVLVNWGKVADLAICNDQLVRELPPTRLPPPLAPNSHSALRGSRPPSPSRCRQGSRPSSAASCR